MSLWASHFASGNVFFTGSVLLLAACGTTFGRGRLGSPRLRRWLALVGIILIVLSSTPLPYWFYGLWASAVVVWVVAARRGDSVRRVRAFRLAAFASGLFCAVGVGWELSTLWPTRQAPIQSRTIYVIGDSVSAGMNEPLDETWPAVMGRRYSADVVNLAQPGGTARSALRQAEGIGDEACVVVIEIGGNDLLSGLSASEFRAHLRALLKQVHRPNRRVLLMELPLPPFCHQYGRAQRELAGEFGAVLISKREFMNVLRTEGATVDGIHLAPRGHALMAEQVWRHTGPLLAAAAASGRPD